MPQPSFRSPPRADALQALAVVHARCVDAREGLARLERGQGMGVLAERLQAMHARHAESVGDMLVQAGQVGTGRGARALMSLSVLLDGAEGDLGQRLCRGEGRVLAAFDAALACDLSCTTLARLRAMRAEVADLVAEARHLR